MVTPACRSATSSPSGSSVPTRYRRPFLSRNSTASNPETLITQHPQHLSLDLDGQPREDYSCGDQKDVGLAATTPAAKAREARPMLRYPVCEWR